MTLPKAEDYAFRFLGTADPKQIELLSFTMKEYARQVLDYAAEQADLTQDTYTSMQEGSTAEVDKQLILKLKDEL